MVVRHEKKDCCLGHVTLDLQYLQSMSRCVAASRDALVHAGKEPRLTGP